MSGVAAPIAEWLRSAELIRTAEDAGVLAAWGALAVDASVSSPLTESADAYAEALRQIEFFGLPIAVETVELLGRQSALVGLSKRIAADAEGYRHGPSVFIIGAEEREGGFTLLTVLRRVEAG